MIHVASNAAWVYEHYLVYLYLSVTDTDCFFSTDELDKIQFKVFKNLDKDRCSCLVNEVFREYRAHSETDKKEYIRSNVSKYLRTEVVRKRVIGELEAILPQDTCEENQELIMFRYIRRIINSTSL